MEYKNVNVDIETGVHYGVIGISHVLGGIFDLLEPVYLLVCQKCGYESTNYFSTCPECETEIEEDDFSEPIYNEYNSNGYHLRLNDNGELWVLKSPYYTYVNECSPCAPNAGNLNSNDGCVKTYCLDESFFDEDTPMPYTNITKFD